MMQKHALREMEEYVGWDPHFMQPMTPPLKKKEFENMMCVCVCVLVIQMCPTLRPHGP